jgi:hypothetical protein
MRKKSLVHNYAPTCSISGCISPVNYKKKYLKKDGTPGASWRVFCDYHRTVGKPQVEMFKKSRGGCENRDARLGFVCRDPDTRSLQVDHWDGDKHNNDQDNLVVLCANCHQEKTRLFGDHLKKYTNVNSNFNKFFDTVL